MLNHFWDICPCQPSFSWAIYVLLYIPLDIQPNPDRKLPTIHGFPKCISNQDNLNFFSANSSNFSIPHFLFHETTMKIERHDLNATLFHRCPTAPVLKRPTTKVTSGRGVSWRRKLLAAFSWCFKQQRVVHHEKMGVHHWKIWISSMKNAWSSLSRHQTWESSPTFITIRPPSCAWPWFPTNKSPRGLGASVSCL